MTLLEPGEVDDDDVIDRDAGEALDRSDGERRAAVRVGGVDLVVAVARDLDPEVARDGEERDPVLVGIRADEHDRVGAEGPLAPGALVRPEHEDGGRVRQDQAVLWRRAPRTARESSRSFASLTPLRKAR